MVTNANANANATANAATALQAGTPAVVTAVVTLAAGVATLLNTIATFARYHTRGAVTMCSYHIAGVPGIVFTQCAQFAQYVATGAMPATLTFTVPAIGAVIPQGSTLLTYRGAVAGGKLGRSSYSALGVRGTFTVCNTLLQGQPAPAAMVVNAVLVQATANTGKATSAVVAAGNVAQATKAGTTVAVPATVAAVAGKVAAAIVASTPVANSVRATGSTAPGKTAAQRKANGKNVA
jgi:hypothetical protein